MKNLSDYQDRYGFIGQKLRDGSIDFGDCGQRTPTNDLAEYVRFIPMLGTTVKRKRLRKQAEKITSRLNKIRKETTGSKNTGYKKTIQYVRHSNGLKWPGKLWVCSRDNFETWLMDMALYNPWNAKLLELNKEILKELTDRKGMLWNYKHIDPGPFDEPKLPGFILPWDLAMYKIRCFRLCTWKRPWNWILLNYYDRDTVVNSIIRVWASYVDPAETNSDLNHINRLVFKQIIYNNPTVWVAKWIYKLLRRNPKPLLATTRMTGNAIQNVLKHQFRKWDDPPMDVVCEPMVKKYI